MTIVIARARQWIADAHVSSIEIGEEFVCIALEFTDINIIKVWSKEAFTADETITSLNKKEDMELIGHENEITNMAIFSRDGVRDSIICSASTDHIFLWHIDSERHITQQVLQQDFTTTIDGLAFDATGTLLAMSLDSEIQILQVENGHLFVQLEGHQNKVTECIFHPLHPHVLLTTSEDRTFKVWDLSNRRLLYQSTVLSPSPMVSIQLHPKTGLLCIGFSNGQLRIYSTEDLSFPREIILIDTANALRKQKHKFQKQQQLDALAANMPPVISSLPVWEQSAEAREATLARRSIASGVLSIEHEHESQEVAEISCSILQIGFLGVDEELESVQEESQTNRGMYQEPQAPTSMFQDNATWIVVATTTHLLLIHARTFECQIFHDFQLPVVPAGLNTHSTMGPVIRIARSVKTKLARDDHSYIECGLISAFQPSYTHVVLTLEHGVEKWNSVEEGPEVDEDISFFPSSPPPATCILRHQYAGNIVLATRKSKKSNNKTKKSNKDQPITFHSKVKSSGYNSALTTMTRGNPRMRRVSGGKTRAPVKTKPKDYPVSCPVIQHPQRKNQLSPAQLKLGPVHTLAYSGDGKVLALGSNAPAVESLRLPIATYRGAGQTFVGGHEGPVHACHWSHHAQTSQSLLLTTSRDASVCMWHTHSTDTPLLNWTLGNTKGSKIKTSNAILRHVCDAQFYYLNKFMLMGSGASLLLYEYQLDLDSEMKPHKPVDDIQGRHEVSKHSSQRLAEWSVDSPVVAFASVNSFLSHLVISASRDKTLVCFDTAAECVVRRIPEAHSRAIHHVTLPSTSAYVSHPPAQYDVFLSAGLDNCVRLWDLRSRRCENRFGQHVNRVHPTGLAMSPCLRYVAVGSEDKLCYVYDIRTGKVLAKLQGHADVVSSVAYHPLHPQLATASYDGKVCFFTDVQEDG